MDSPNYIDDGMSGNLGSSSHLESEAGINTVQELLAWNREMQAMHRRLGKVKVEAALMLAEFSSLRDPIMRLNLGMAYQGYNESKSSVQQICMPDTGVQRQTPQATTADGYSQMTDGTEDDSSQITEGKLDDSSQMSEGKVDDSSQMTEGKMDDSSQMMEGEVDDRSQMTEGQVDDSSQMMEDQVDDSSQMMEDQVDDSSQMTDGIEDGNLQIIDGLEDENSPTLLSLSPSHGEKNKQIETDVLNGDKDKSVEISGPQPLNSSPVSELLSPNNPIGVQDCAGKVNDASNLKILPEGGSQNST